MSTMRLWSSATFNARAYPLVMRWKNPGLPPTGFAVLGARRNKAESIGVVVSEITIEMMIASDSVMANSRKSRPIRPPISRIGRNTAISESVIETMVNPTSPAPRSAASTGGLPSSRYREMFSVTTIASSTTKPVAMVSAISDRLSRL